MKIYLSPSKQPANTYAAWNTNEQEQMERLAQAVALALSKYEGVEVKVGSPNLTVIDATHGALPGRVWEAKEWGADIYMPLHSNAAGKPSPNTQGPVVLLGRKSAESTKIASAILDELTKLAPHPTPYAQIVYDKAFTEIVKPQGAGMLPVYLEVEFHDQSHLAKYINNNTSNIADAIARGIASAYGLHRRSVSGSGASAGSSTGKLYRVYELTQRGAFSVKSNADKMLAELESQGKKAIIQEV